MINRKLAIFLCLILVTAVILPINATTPEVVTYQGHLTDGGGTPLSGNYNITFSIYSDVVGGIAIWSEVQNINVSAGALNILMGAISPLSQSVFSDSIRYLGVKVGGDAEMARTRLTAAPFAYRIATVDGSVSKLLVLEEPNNTRVELGVGEEIMKVYDSTGFLRMKMSLEGGTGSRGLDGGGAISFFRPSALKNADGSAVSTSLVRIGESVFGTGEVEIFDSVGNRLAQVTATSLDGGAYYTFLADSTRLTIQGQATDTGGYVGTYGANGNRQTALTSLVNNPGHGYLAAFDSYGFLQAGMYTDNWGDGHFKTFNNNGYKMVEIATTDPFWGISGGLITVLGNNGTSNVELTQDPGHGSSGRVDVFDSVGVAQAGIFVNAAGQGIVWGDVKSFAMANPNKAGTEIWYASLEGPEVAAYHRGTAELINGEAVVLLPDYFSAIINEKGMTVQIVPLSADSKGLAVIEKQPGHIVVRELMNGTGSYSFDFTVTAVRKGFEDYQVIRDVTEREAMMKAGKQDRVDEPVSLGSDKDKPMKRK